jgi:hypothetical protein
MGIALFAEQRVDEYFIGVWKSILPKIDAIPASQVANLDPSIAASELIASVRFDCPVLGDDISMDEPAFSEGAESTIVRVYVPFNGYADLFRCHGHHYPVLPHGFTVKNDHLVISHRIEKRRIDHLREEILDLLKRVKEGLSDLHELLRHQPLELKQRIEQRIRERQQEVSKHSELLGKLAKGGFPLQKRGDGKESIIVPVKPKPIVFQASPTPSKPVPEPELSSGDYDAILQVIRDMVTVFERSPSVFRSMEEEHLRTILLVALNGIFKGAATGETFNGAGKTDILIRVNNSNIFIAECLIWDGPAGFQKKLTDQLFRYSTWRDSKLAAIIFNRNKDFTGVVQKMKQVVDGLPNRNSSLAYPDPTGCRHVFRRADDPQKEFTLTCLAFEVPF